MIPEKPEKERRSLVIVDIKKCRRQREILQTTTISIADDKYEKTLPGIHFPPEIKNFSIIKKMFY